MTDPRAPDSVCPVLHAFVVPLLDAMPLRGRLKGRIES